MFKFYENLLCNFEHSEQPECPEGREAKGSSPLTDMNPHNLGSEVKDNGKYAKNQKNLVHLENGSADDDAVESVEGRVEVCDEAEGVHSHTW